MALIIVAARGQWEGITLPNYWLLNAFSRRVAGITPELPTSLFNGVTDAQGQDRAERYINKRMRLSGSLPSAVQSSRRSAIIIFKDRPGPSNVEVHCMIKGRKNVTRIEAMSPGDAVTLVGRIQRVDRQAVMLDRCEVVT
jgi:hypothetical protein